MSSLKGRIEKTLGPLDTWWAYYVAIAAASRACGLPEGAALFWSAVASLDDGDTIRDPAGDRVFQGVVATLDDDGLVSAMGGATALIETHEEGGAFETARTLRAAHDVAAAEYERRRAWDA